MFSTKEILQIDATVLAGVLILTTIISFEEIATTQASVFARPNVWLFWSGGGFSLSALFAIIASFFEKKDTLAFFWLRLVSLSWMFAGFIFLFIIFFIIGEYQSLIRTGIISNNSTNT